MKNLITICLSLLLFAAPALAEPSKEERAAQKAEKAAQAPKKNKAAQRAEMLGVVDIKITITHTRDDAMVFVISQKEHTR